MELVSFYLQREENNLGLLRDTDPEIFPRGYPRIVQRDRQPIVFDPEDADILLAAPPGTFANILSYRGNYYVAPLGSEYPYVGLIKKQKIGGVVCYPACFKQPPKDQEGQVTLEQLWGQIGSRFTCSTLAEFQAHVREKAHLGLDLVLASVARQYEGLGPLIGF